MSTLTFPTDVVRLLVPQLPFRVAGCLLTASQDYLQLLRSDIVLWKQIWQSSGFYLQDFQDLDSVAAFRTALTVADSAFARLSHGAILPPKLVAGRPSWFSGSDSYCSYSLTTDHVTKSSAICCHLIEEKSFSSYSERTNLENVIIDVAPEGEFAEPFVKVPFTTSFHLFGGPFFSIDPPSLVFKSPESTFQVLRMPHQSEAPADVITLHATFKHYLDSDPLFHGRDLIPRYSAARPLVHFVSRYRKSNEGTRLNFRGHPIF